MLLVNNTVFLNPFSISGYEIDDEEDSEEGPQGYLAASLDLIPGYFACDVVWRHYFTIHPRLKHMQRGGPPMGVLVLRSILNKFIVTNRKNMFVIEELSSKNVFYLRLVPFWWLTSWLFFFYWLNNIAILHKEDILNCLLTL